MPSKMQLAKEAIHTEQNILKENVGSQDQVFAAFGGLCRIGFNGEEKIDIQPITVKPERLSSLQDHMLLFFTGLSRTASDVAFKQIKETPNKKRDYSCII